MGFLPPKDQELPTKKISTPLLILGIILIALSYGVKIIEPDYDASRKAAGIIDVYEWIIANDMLGEETADVFEAWDNSEESIQFWAWFDSDWSPKILLFNSIEGGLRKVGAVLAICGILVFTTIILAFLVIILVDHPLPLATFISTTIFPTAFVLGPFTAKIA